MLLRILSKWMRHQIVPCWVEQYVLCPLQGGSEYQASLVFGDVLGIQATLVIF